MKKHTLLLTFILTLAASVFAENVTIQTAQTVAQSFLNSKMSPTPKLMLINYAEKAEFQNFYVFGNGHCFVIIAADDRVHPVLGYSTENAFGMEKMPENIYGWLKSYNEGIALAVSNRMEATMDIRTEWNELLNGHGLSPKTRINVAPLVRTIWDQGTPYNNRCPMDTSGRVPTGCGATAMAQVMNYWEHPVRGIGSHSYTPSTHPEYGVLDANFGATVYDWDNMRNDYSYGYTEEEADAVATLMYHCGVAVEMNYKPDGSGTTFSLVQHALMTYFDYNPNMEKKEKSSIINGIEHVYYSDEEWITLLKNELNLHRPLYYQGGYYISETNNMAHALVCDGYDENDLFHFNWGWGGSSNGYYAIGSLNTGNGNNQQWNQWNWALFGCFPNTPSINPPSNISTTVNGRNVNVQWNNVSNASSYKLYRDGDLVANNITTTNYTESNVVYGTHYYYVKSVKSDGTMSLGSNKTIANVHFAGPVPSDLQVTTNENDVNLTWQAPNTGSTILQYGTGNVISGYGYGANQEMYWAQRYPKETLCLYAGMAINKISVYFRKPGTYTLFIYKGNETNTSELVYQQDYYTETINSWQDIIISNSVFVDYTQDLWVVLYSSNIDFPASFCAYSGSGVENAAYFSSTGNSWGRSGNYQHSWMMKTYISDSTYTYNLFRNGTNVANNIGSNSYNDTNLPDGFYNYYVTTNYYGGESDPSNTVSVLVGNPTFTITAIANPTSGGITAGSGTYNYNQSCTLTATANQGYTFVRWTKDGTEVSNNTSYTFTVTESATYIAHFQAQSYTITISASPATGGSVSGGGTYNYGQSCTVHATANEGYTFVNWTENGAPVSTYADYTFTITDSRTIVANFQQQSFTIAASVNPNNGGSVSGEGTYNYGQICTLLASPANGYTFTNWTENGNAVSSIPNYSFTVNCDRSLVANFLLDNYIIALSAQPTNGGTVTGGGAFHYGDNCTVYATANSGYTFINWTENGTQVSTNANYTFTVTGNRNLVANFQAQPQQYTINVSASPANGGSVTGGGTYQQGQTCTVSATANSGYTFVNWTENGTQVSTNASYTFTVTGNRNLVAHFTTQNHVITAMADPANGGTVTGSGGYNYGESCTLTATANAGYTFINWTKNGTQVSTNPTYTFTVTESATYIAHFSAQSYTVTTASSPSNGGTTTGGGTYNYGQTCTVTASAANGYAFINWTENGAQVSTNATYSFTVTSSRNLVANFAQSTHTIQASAGANGIITPSGSITVAHGANQSFAMIPDEGYEVQDVYIDGNSVGPMTSYTFTNVTADHFIHVTFVHVDGIGENNISAVVYPNPTKGIVNIKRDEAEQINVFNVFGQLLISQATNGNEQEIIDISNLPNGLYLLEIIGQRGVVTKQIIKAQ